MLTLPSLEVILSNAIGTVSVDANGTKEILVPPSRLDQVLFSLTEVHRTNFNLLEEPESRICVCIMGFDSWIRSQYGKFCSMEC